MPGTSVFVQRCPVCGRQLEIRVRYLGKMVTCHHCRGEFVACDPSSDGLSSHTDLLHRAERLIDLSQSFLPPESN